MLGHLFTSGSNFKHHVVRLQESSLCLSLVNRHVYRSTAHLFLTHFHGVVPVRDLVLDNIFRRPRVLEGHELHKLVLHVLRRRGTHVGTRAQRGKCRQKFAPERRTLSGEHFDRHVLAREPRV